MEDRAEPKARQKPCDFRRRVVHRWVHKSWETTSGGADAPYWATLDLKLDVEKEGRRAEKYVILTENKKRKEKKYEISLNNWEKIKKGDVLTVKMSLGTISEILKIENGK